MVSRVWKVGAPVVGVLTLALVAGSVEAGGSVAAAPVSLRVVTDHPLVGEPTVLRGDLRPSGRPVALQVQRGSSWHTVDDARTGRRGVFGFTVRATAATAAYRVVARQARVSGRSEPARTSTTARVTGGSGRGSISVSSTPTGQRSDGTANLFPGRATFSPARPGRPVHVYRMVGGRWRWVVSSTQDRSGGASFLLPRSAITGPTQLEAVTVPAGSARPITSSVQTVTPKRLTFSDDFGGSRLDPTKWGLRAQPYTGNRLCARPAADRVTVRGGVARLSVRKIARSRVQGGKRVCTAYGVWDNAMIGTGSSSRPFTQKYGVFAARVALQRATGMHGSFWVQGPGTTGAEIDVVEFFGMASKDGLTTKVHYTPTTGPLQSAGSPNLRSRLGRRSPTQWNVYSVEWTPTRYVFRINGTVTWTTSKPHMSTAQQEIVLSLLTSDWNLHNLKDPSATMAVDWVRAWAY